MSVHPATPAQAEVPVPRASAGSTGSLATIYRYFAQVSTAMLEAAQRGEWEAVSEGERSCAQLVELLRTHKPMPGDDAERRECMDIIRKVLADDAAIRGLAQPAMAELDRILRPNGNQHRMLVHSFR